MSLVSRSIFSLVACMFFSCALIPSIAASDTLLSPGDKIQLSVIGVQELFTVATVENDGSIKFPIVGRVQAKGKTADQLETQIALRLGQETIRVGGLTDDVWLQLETSKVFVTVAEFRPVYVTGLVQLGGEIPFRAGMTARQALIVAGGLGNDLETVSATEIARTASDRFLISKQIEIAASDVTRLQAELGEIEQDIRSGANGKLSIGGEGYSVAETEWLTAKSTLRGLNEKSLDRTYQQLEERLGVLEKLQEVNTQTLQAFENEYSRFQELAKRGVATASSAEEAQRGALVASGQVFETLSESYRVRVDMVRTEDASELDLAGEHVRTLDALLSEMRQLKDLEARLDALNHRYTLLVGIGPDEGTSDISVVIHRSLEEDTMRLDALLDTRLEPGDVVEFRR